MRRGRLEGLSLCLFVGAVQERTRSVADAAAGGGVQCTGGLNQIDSCVEGPQVHLLRS